MTDGATIRAAGGVLWRPAGSGIEIAVVHRPRYDDWSMPKGKLRPGEQPLLAACREVVEETGVRPIVGRRLPAQEYRLGPDRKIVDYWEMTPADVPAASASRLVAEGRAVGGRAVGAVEGTTGPAAGPAVDTSVGRGSEVDVVRWLRPAEAATWISYDRDRELLRAFLALPPADNLVVLVRHGRAGERSSWPGDDRLRPLEPGGLAQAQALRALAWFGPRRVYSADRVRCVQSVAPLADDLGVPVETEPALTEDAYLAQPERGLRRIREIAASRVRAVVCSQRQVIPDLVSWLAAADGLVLGKVSARKGAVWALSFMDGRVVGADYYPSLTQG